MRIDGARISIFRISGGQNCLEVPKFIEKNRALKLGFRHGSSACLRIFPMVVAGVLLTATGALHAATLIDLGTVVGSANVGGTYFFPLLESGGTITASGTGAFNPFLAYENNGSEQGFNTSSGFSGPLNAVDIAGDTRDITVSELSSYTYGGVGYYAFGLDINENAGGSRFLSVDKLEVWVRSSPLSSPTAYSSLSGSGATKVWDLDGVQDTTLLLIDGLIPNIYQADYLFLMPKTLIDNAVASMSWNVYFYAQQGAAGSVNGNSYSTDGVFEEWSIVTGYSALTPPPVVPETSTYAAGVFMAGAAWAAWHRRRRKTPPSAPGTMASAVSTTAPVGTLDESALASGVVMPSEAHVRWRRARRPTA